jgi:transcriptional regulator with XRE-family HTH domain
VIFRSDANAAHAANSLPHSPCAIENAMTPTRLRECLEALRWSQRELAAELGCSDRLVRRWAAGSLGYAVPERVSEWLEVLAPTHIRHPAPTDLGGLRPDVVTPARRETRDVP